MRLKAKLLLLVISVALGVSVFSSANAWVGSRVNSSVQEGVVRQKIVRDLFELNILTYDYLRIREERAQAQWERKYDDVLATIRQLQGKDKRESASIERMQQDLGEVRRLFSKVIDDDPASDDAFNDALTSSLLTQLFATTHSMATAAATLSESNISDAQDQGQQTVLIMLVSGLLLTVFLTAIAFSIASSLGRAVYKLKNGVTEFATGNLSHILDVRTNDELSELGESFNQMARKLSKSYDSLRRSSDEQRRLAEENSAITGIGRIISSSLDINEVYDRFALELKKLVDLDWITVHAVNSEAGTYNLKYIFGPPRPGRPVGRDMPMEGSRTAEVLATGKPVCQTDTAKDPKFPADNALSDTGFRSALAVPLISKGKVFGTVTLRSRNINNYGPREQEILERLAYQISPAMENALLYEQTMWAGEELRKRADELAQSNSDLQQENAARLRAAEELVDANEALGRQVIERTRSEEALRESQERLDAILDGAHDAIISVDSDNRICLFNRGAEKMFGYSAEKVSGESLNILLPHRFAESHRGHLRHFIEDSGPETSKVMNDRGQVFGRRSDGTEFPAEASISKIEVRGEIVCTTTLRDISERVRAHEELAHRASELARSNAELEQFAYVASHDLQEPLRSIVGFTRLLTRRYQGKLDEDADGLMMRITNATGRMQVLILDLLAYSRVGREVNEFGSTNCDSIVDAEISNLQAAIEETGASVTHDSLPAVEGHTSLVSQLFRNLISNAIKFRGEEPPRIHISADQQDDEWVFSVRDNGIGFEPEYAEQIFTIFQRLHTQDEYPGTGIGLAVSKKVVNCLGGRIWVDSQEGKGSTFYFTVPIAGDKKTKVPARP